VSSLEPDPRRDPRALAPGEPGLEPARPPALTTMEPARLSADPADEDATHFWDYWRVLRRRRWTVITCFLGVVIAATLWVFTERPVYTGTLTLRIEKEPPRVVKFDEVVRESEDSQDYYQTQYRILHSRTLANRVIGLLQLDQHPEFARPDADQGWRARAHAALREALVKWVPVAPPPAADVNEEELAPTSPLTGAVLSRLRVEPIRGSRLVKVSFESHHPDLAARVPNTLGEAFIAHQLDHKVAATRYATQFLAQQLEQARQKLGQSEAALSQFLQAHDILFIGAADRTGQGQDLVTQQLTMLSEAHFKARAERIARESLVAQAAAARDVASLPAVLQSGLIAGLKQDLATQEAEAKRLGQIFKPDYPRMQQLDQKMAETRRQLGAEIDRAVAALQADYQAAGRNERELEAALAQHRTLARGLSDSMAEYNLLRRDVDTSRDLHAALLSRLRETQISAALFTSTISIVDRAEIPATPSRPNKRFALLVAGVIGLVGGIGLAFVSNYLDTNLKDAREVEHALRVPILGLVPTWHAGNGRRGRRPALTEGQAPEHAFALVAHADMASIYAEAFRGLRTNLLYSRPERPPRTLMITSLQPEDGKTSLATNLGVTLAQLDGGPVLLVDADMRRPNLHEVLALPRAPGLSTYLTGQAALDDVVAPTAIPNLCAIPSGPSPVNPAELLASTRLKQALETLGQRFAHIVFDTGPLFGVSDAMILTGQVEGTILVLRQGRAGRDAAQRAIRSLLSVRARLLGVILNDMDVHGYGYYGYYGYAEHGAHQTPA
jgi:succinoglycan biosynthesis transport protein ExoP